MSFNKRIDKLLKLLLIIVATFFVSSINVSAKEVDVDSVDKYHVDIKVNEDGSIHIRNKMNVKFATPKHGMYAAIPIKYNTDGNDLPSTIRTPIQDVEVKDRNYKMEYEGDYAFIRIGDEDKYIEGLQSFEFSYKLKFRDLKTAHHFLYFNIIGDRWAYDMDNISFKIKMPKEIKGTPKFLTRDSKDESKVKYKIEGNIISGKYDGTLRTNSGLTIYYDLGPNYFIYPQDSNNTLFTTISIVVLVTSGLIYFVFGRNKKLITPIQFKPPKNFSPAMVGYVADETFDKEDSSSLFVYWASKGYMKIKEEDEETFEFTKTKEIDNEEMSIEKSYFNKLFGTKKEVQSDKLSRDFVELTYSMSKDYADHFSKDKALYKKSSKKLKNILRVLLFIAFIATVEFFASDYFDVGEVSGIIVVVCFVIFFITSLGVDNVIKKKDMRVKTKSIGYAILYLLIILLPITILFVFILDTPIFVPIIIGLSYYISLYFILSIRKRTMYGDQILGEIYGFREFIEKAELERIEMFVKENPVYFYEILPYAYTLGLSDTWIKKFETIEIPQVDWFNTRMGVMDYIFLTHMTSSLNTMSQAASFHPDFKSSGSSFGGFSGGGSSGGGFGGGGGGSW